MSRQFTFAFVFLCGFAALTVSTEPCKENVLQGTSCTIKIKTDSKTKPNEVKWARTLTNGNVTGWKTKPKTPQGIEMEEDGSITFSSLSQKDSGTYKYDVYNEIGGQIGSGKVKINVYAKAPKPTAKFTCDAEASAVVTCEFEGSKESKDMLISWIKDGSIMQNENKSQLVLRSSEVKEEKAYSCDISNPVSQSRSEPTKVSCSGPGIFPKTLWGFDFWVMVGILAAGGVLLLLMICVLIICSCRSCSKRKKQEDEEEFRLQAFQDPASNGTNRSKNTARGQPAPPIPQEKTMNSRSAPNTPPPQPKAQVRARPPPPPQHDDEEYPPPLPHPRNKQHRKRNQEPYRPME